MSAIIWPGAYLPGFTGNFASNEIIAAGLSAADIFPLLEQAHLWPSYYANSANIRFHQAQKAKLQRGTRFYFETFGLPVKAEIVEDLPQNRARILTQETQNGNPAKELATTRPNPMINGHQQGLDRLVAAATVRKKKCQ